MPCRRDRLSRAQTPCRTNARQRGFTYLWLLFVLAAGAAGLAALGARTSTAVQRDREAELMFRGGEIARALAAYQAATPDETKVLPATLRDLLVDERGARTMHHLRRLYVDPFTGKADWELIKTNDGRITGVRSRAAVRALRTVDLPVPEPGKNALVSDRLFMASPPDPARTDALRAGASAKPLHGPVNSPFGPSIETTRLEN